MLDWKIKETFDDCVLLRKMSWTILLILVFFQPETSFGWTYHFSDAETMNWTEARKWCQSRFSDMVAFQNQKENDHVVSLLPNRTGSPYYWIGITKNHLNETWKWIGNNSTWVGNHSWATKEPNNVHVNEFCVEIYVNNGPNRGKWNDEKCSNKKFPVCYKAQCENTSCERGSCQETIDNTTCLCEAGFYGDRCQTAMGCAPLPRLDHGHHSCSGGTQKFHTTCTFKCNPGFILIGSSVVTCKAIGIWSQPRPFCSSKCQKGPVGDPKSNQRLNV
uniref:Selectin E n=1 Tax=Oryzias latipes TaxID=8090 RepID=A0A3P9L3G3_ORYLA